MEKLTNYMATIKKQVQKHMNDSLRPLNVTGAEAIFIKYLQDNKKCRQSDLAKNLDCDKAYIHRVTTKLIEKEIIKTNSQQELSLTAKGIKISNYAQKAMSECKNHLKQGISEEEMSVAYNILKKCAENSLKLNTEN